MTHKNKKLVPNMASLTPHETPYTFENGMPGFPELTSFYIRKLMDGSYPPLEIMVSVQNPGISFILYPHVHDKSFFDHNTLTHFAQSYDCIQKDVDVYSIVTIRKPEGNIHLTTNLKAPIILDRLNHKGWQHIIPSKESDLAYPLEQLSLSFQASRQNSA